MDVDPNPFLAALDLERKLREEAYIDAPHYICGIPIKQITPRILAVLFRIETPFLSGCEMSEAEIARFLWACHVNYAHAEPDRWLRRSNKDRFLKSLRGFDFELAEAEIWEFLDHTFLDAPQGGGRSRPYVCSIASMEYSMACKPFNWPREYTLDQPLRIIYQLMKCRARDNGLLLANRISDPILQRAIDEINSPEEMAQRAEEFHAKFGGN